MDLQIGISIELREQCVKLFKLCDEFSSPDKLRAFVSVKDLEPVRECIVYSEHIDFDQLIDKLLRTGRSFLEPALFNLLDALAVRYEEDAKGQACIDLKDSLQKAIPKPEEASDYQSLIQSSAPGKNGGQVEKAQQWVKEAGDDLDELALRITLAVFSGTTLDVIERAKNDLLEVLEEFFPVPKQEVPSPAGIPMTLFGRLERAGAVEKDPQAPDWKIVFELDPEIASHALSYVWRWYSERKWRQKLTEWLTSYAVGRPVDVRTRAAVAAGRLAIVDYRFFRDNLLDRWVRAKDHQSEYRTAIGMALGVLVREERWAHEVQGLLKEWSQSTDQSERWAAMRAYIYVGSYCRPVSEVIARWRDIASSEIGTVNIQLIGRVYLRLTHPLHMSLVDAMMRFFMNIVQFPVEEQRPLFESALEGLETWIAADGDDASLGLSMFMILAEMTTPVENAHLEVSPVLLRLVEENEKTSAYRKRLASLFNLTLRKATSVLEAKELLCKWLRWINSLKANANVYEERFIALLAQVIADDTTGRMRGQLVAGLGDCGRVAAFQRIVAGL
jgi:hypothetical protein